MVKGNTKEKRQNTERVKRVYREFSRQRYIKYKRQFPRMRESDLVSKIIKEWEYMDEEAKLNLEHDFIQQAGKDFFRSGSSSLSKSKNKSKTPSRRETFGGSHGTYTSLAPSTNYDFSNKQRNQIKKKSPKVRVFVEKKKSPQRESSDFKQSLSKSFRQYESSSNQLEIPQKLDEQRSLKIAKNSAYLQFFKYYYERLGAEHPRWSSHQIKTIIKLLWKKRQKQMTTNNFERRKAGKKGKKSKSGWEYYRKKKESEGYTLLLIKSMWKSLPFESKQFYKLEGLGSAPRIKRTQGSFLKKLLNSGRTQYENSLQDVKYSWMKNQMN